MTTPKHEPLTCLTNNRHFTFPIKT